MAIPIGLSHVAMSVPRARSPTTIGPDCSSSTANCSAGVRSNLGRPDRLTISVGLHTYVNVRERADPMVCCEYEHFGIVVASTEEAERLWKSLAADDAT